jgi:DNA-directed RNA polymerase specialized sigma subunit
MKNKKIGYNQDAWRFCFVGTDDYIIDSMHYINPEADYIAYLDGDSKEEGSPDVHSVLENLPQRYKQILWEYFFDGFTLEEMGLKRKVTKQYMHQELKKGLALMHKGIQE